MAQNFRRLISVIIITAIFIIAAYVFVCYKGTSLAYHRLRVALFGDITKNYEYTKEDYIDFSNNQDSKSYSLKWCFRPEARYFNDDTGLRIPYYPFAIVADTDNDGKGEVYIASYTKKVYCLDGESGKILWTYRLPFGITAGVTTQLIDVDKDGVKELIFASHAPLPIRIYCIRTGKNVSPGKRLLWYKNVKGDFMEGALTSFVNNNGETRIIYGTRSAPYITGSFGVLDGRGRPLNPPTESVDICMAKPSIYSKEGNVNYAITGSHQWAIGSYGESFIKKKKEKYGNHIICKEVENGKIVWAANLGYDTGYAPSIITDLNFDGKKELVVLPLNGYGGNTIIDPESGKVVGHLSYVYKCHFMTKDGSVRYLGTDNEENLYCFDSNGEKIYMIPGKGKAAKYLLDIDNNGSPEFLYEEFGRDYAKIYVHDAASGTLKNELRCDIETKELKGSAQNYYDQHAIADTDNDGYWEVVTLINGYIICFDTPFKIKKEYPKYHDMLYGNVQATGYNLYDSYEKN